MEEYSFLWIMIAGVFLGLSFFHPLIDRVAHWLGIDYGPTALFLFFNVVTVFILIHFSIQLSDYKTKKRILAQEVALLRDRVDELSRRTGGRTPATGRRIIGAHIFASDRLYLRH